MDSMTQRRYDLDWLRVAVFAMLIFYHVGMLYVADWGYHYKSEHQSTWLQNLMILLNQWRLPLLFLISGIAIRFFLHRTTWTRFVGLRTLRLWVPLLFGIWVVVPPQLYIEMLSKGDLPAISYGAFYQAFLDLSHPYFESYQSGIFPHVDVNHLWYIRELWYFSMYLLALYAALHWLKLMPYLYWPFKHWPVFSLFAILVIGLALLQVWVFPADSEGTRKALGFSFLCCGFLMGWEPKFWQQLGHHRKHFLILAVLAFAVLITYYHGYYQNNRTTGGLYVLERLLVFTNRWAWIFAILGHAYHHCNRNHPWLRYLNQAVYPYYILHQTFIIVLAYLLRDWGPVWQPITVIILTFSGCALAYELIRRSAVLRLLFGLKIGQPTTNKAMPVKDP